MEHKKYYSNKTIERAKKTEYWKIAAAIDKMCYDMLEKGDDYTIRRKLFLMAEDKSTEYVDPKKILRDAQHELERLAFLEAQE